MPATRCITLLIAAAAFWISFHSKAVEPLSSPELVSHCELYFDDPDGEDAIFCVRYIQGFIDGAVATDERVLSNLTKETNKAGKKESFSERAMRVRGRNVGKLVERYGATYYADFCLDVSVSLKEVVEKSVEIINATDNSELDGNARDLVFRILRDNYPCPQE